MSGTNGKAIVASAPIRCVVADDHPAILDAVSRFLEGERGFALVGRAGDGEAALQLIYELEPEIALLDIRMPGFGGIEIAAKLAASPATTSVVLFTAYPERALLLAALDVGVRGIILKEAPLDELARALASWPAAPATSMPPWRACSPGRLSTTACSRCTKREPPTAPRLLAQGMRDEQAGRTLSISPR